MEVPPSLKSLAPYIRLSKQFEARDPVVSYYCQLYFVQNGIKIASKDNEGKTYLFGVMDRLEQVKKGLIEAGNEAVSNDIVASSHIESKGLQLFIFADGEDRAANFDVKVIKSFYVASLLFGLLSMFGELPDEIVHQQKYAEWKATYLERCRKTGEVPEPGPQLHDEEESGDFGQNTDQPGASSDNSGQPTFNAADQQAYNPPAQPTYNPATQPTYNPATQPTYNPPTQPTFNQTPQQIYNQPTFDPSPQSFISPAQQPQISGSSTPGKSELLQLDVTQYTELDYEKIEKVQKLCRFASSALNYKDYKSCLENLQRAMNLVRCGKEE